MRYLTIALMSIVLLACTKDDEVVDFTAANEAEIEKYLTDNNLTAQKSASGLYYIVDEAGEGPQPLATSTVRVKYKGYFTDGEVFDESDENGISFNLQGVIRGWMEGITYFNEGGSGKLLIPSSLGYGSGDFRGIPGGSVLVFDIELLQVDFLTQNEKDIATYLEDNSIEAEKSASGLYYVIEEPGTGTQPNSSSTVTVNYKGYLLDGTVFDQSRPSGATFALSQVILGWTEGIAYFKEGGKGMLIIPAHLAYKDRSVGSIPVGSVLVFDIELLEVK